MGNRNDYLPLEEASRMLGRPVTLLTLLGEEGVTAKLTGGQWVISEQDLEKLRGNLPPEPESIVHNFLSNGSTKKRKKPSRATGSVGTSSPNGAQKKRKSQPPKQHKAKKSKHPKGKKGSTTKRSHRASLPRKTDEVLFIGKAIEAFKNTGDESLLRAKIKELAILEYRLHTRLKKEARPSQELLCKWKWSRDQRDRLTEILEGRKNREMKREDLEELRAVEAYYERARQEAESNPSAKWPTKRRFWWNEE